MNERYIQLASYEFHYDGSHAVGPFEVAFQILK